VETELQANDILVLRMKAGWALYRQLITVMMHGSGNRVIVWSDQLMSCRLCTNLSYLIDDDDDNDDNNQ
jgi:hypothetical protein